MQRCNLFNNEKSADIVFEVGDDEMKSSVGLSRYHAHRLILQECAPSELCPPPDEENDITNIPITDVHPEWWENCAKEIIYAADKYGVINLKLEAEAVYMLTQLRLQ